MAYGGSKILAPLILNTSNLLSLVVRFTPLPLYPRKKKPWHKFQGIVTNPFFPRFHTRKEGVHQREEDVVP